MVKLRNEIFLALAGGKKTVKELAEELDRSKGHVSNELRVLRQSYIVDEEEIVSVYLHKPQKLVLDVYTIRCITNSLKKEKKNFEELYKKLMDSEFGEKVVHYLFNKLSVIANQDIVWDFAIKKLDWTLNEYPDVVCVYPEDANEREKGMEEYKKLGLPAKSFLSIIKQSPDTLSFLLDLLENKVDKSKLDRYYYRGKYFLNIPKKTIAFVLTPKEEKQTLEEEIEYILALDYYDFSEEILKAAVNSKPILERWMKEGKIEELKRESTAPQPKPDELAAIILLGSKTAYGDEGEIKIIKFKIALSNTGELTIPPKCNLHHFINYITIYPAILGSALLDKGCHKDLLYEFVKSWKMLVHVFNFEISQGFDISSYEDNQS